MDWVVWAADNKKEAITRPSDKKNGVLRDDLGTSFHTNSYSNGIEAKEGLRKLIESVVVRLEKLSPAQRLEFAQKMEWDNDRGCIEARVAPALMWAALKDSLDTVPLLNDIIDKCVKNNKGEIPSIASILSYCLQNQITHVSWSEETSEVDTLLIQRYLKDTFDHEELQPTTETISIADEKKSSSDSMFFFCGRKSRV